MGLDAWLYRVRKLSDEELLHVTGYNYDLGIVCCPADDEYLLESIEGIYRRKTLNTEIFDMPRIRQAAKVSESAVCTGQAFSNRGITFTFRDTDDHSRSITFRDGEFLTHEYIDYLVFGQEELTYWRNNHDLDEELAEACGGFEDCAYIYLNDAMKEIVLRYVDEITAEDLEDTADSCIVYHPWW